MKQLFIAALIILVGAPAFAAQDEFPRTAAGKLDFSGTYNVASLTPYTRRTERGNDLYLDPVAAAEVEAAAAARVDKGNIRSDPNRSPPEKGGNVDARSYDYGWLDPGNTMFKIDGKYRSSIIVDPPNGRMPAVSEMGKARRASLRPRPYKNDGTAWWLEEGGDPYDNPEGLSMNDRCLYIGAVTVPVRPVVYNNMKTIVQTDTHVLISVEWMHWARIIRLDSEHLPGEARSLSGDSIGWWEDDTLVVETTNFFALPGVPREGLRVVERFSALDRDRLLYQFTVHDSDYTAPYSGEFPWPKSTEKNYEFACHEGNYSMANTLRGARFLEEQWMAEHGEPVQHDR